MELVAPEGTTRDGDQLVFLISRSCEAPWSGQSPRVLTRMFRKFSLRAFPAGGLRDLK